MTTFNRTEYRLSKKIDDLKAEVAKLKKSNAELELCKRDLYSNGRTEGREQLQHELRELLGIKEIE